MNDRYLFKAKRKMWRKFPKNEHWIIWDAITGKPREAILNETICQCTSLKDKNGILIWESDVVEVLTEDGYFVVEWDSDSARFVMNGDGLTIDFDNYWSNETEVVDNAIDNPELLEVE